MSGISYYICDSETNGIDSKRHEMCEISIIRCSDRVQLTEFIKCEHPENSSFDALAITGKTLADLEKGISKEEAVEKIDKFLAEDGGGAAGRCFIAHNAPFDRRFIHALYDKCGKQFPADFWACTLAMAKAYVKKMGLGKTKVNLHAACDLLGIKKIASAHNAKMDSRNGYLIWKNLTETQQIDHLPFIKNFAHMPANKTLPIDDEDLLDLNDV